MNLISYEYHFAGLLLSMLKCKIIANGNNETIEYKHTLTHKHTHIQTQTPRHTYTHSHTNKHLLTLAHAQTQTHTHTHTHTDSQTYITYLYIYIHWWNVVETSELTDHCLWKRRLSTVQYQSLLSFTSMYTRRIFSDIDHEMQYCIRRQRNMLELNIEML